MDSDERLEFLDLRVSAGRLSLVFALLGSGLWVKEAVPQETSKKPNPFYALTTVLLVMS